MSEGWDGTFPKLYLSRLFIYSPLLDMLRRSPWNVHLRHYGYDTARTLKLDVSDIRLIYSHFCKTQYNTFRCPDDTMLTLGTWEINPQALIDTHRSKVKKLNIRSRSKQHKIIESYNDHTEISTCHLQMTKVPCDRAKCISSLGQIVTLHLFKSAPLEPTHPTLANERSDTH